MNCKLKYRNNIYHMYLKSNINFCLLIFYFNIFLYSDCLVHCINLLLKIYLSISLIFYKLHNSGYFNNSNITYIFALFLIAIYKAVFPSLFTFYKSHYYGYFNNSNVISIRPGRFNAGSKSS